MKLGIFVSLLCVLVGCGRQQQRPQVTEIEGSTEQRVAKATEILKKYCTPPGLLLDARMAEDIFDNSGGMVPGPSDSHIYGILTVALSELPDWERLLSNDSSTNVQIDLLPDVRPVWWPSDSSFSNAKYFKPQPLIGRSCGWVAIIPSSSTIVFYAFDP